MVIYCDVVVRNLSPPFANGLTYACLKGEAVPGQLVSVPLRRGEAEGVVIRTHHRRPVGSYVVRPVLRVLPPILRGPQIAAVLSIAQHDCCTVRQALSVALPALTRWSSLLSPNAWEREPKQRTSRRKPQVLVAPPHMRVKEYEDAIRSVVARRRTVLLLSPFQERAEEWAQLLEERGMGSSMIFTSKLPMRERKDCFRRCLGGENGIVIGTRSALFLPFQRLGLVIVDDEHHPFYKSDRTPRYHAREIARVIAEESGATLILGSCSPSVESWGAFRRGECVLKMRASSGNLRASLIDLQDTPCSPFPLSAPLLSLLAKEVSEGRRVMVFLNDRRRLSDAASLLKRRFGEEALIFRTLPSLPLSTLSDVVVALDADVLRNIPNFRAAEWTFQQLMHCRALAREHLIIQTRRPEAPEIRAAVSGDVTSFLDAELSERRRAGYPPFQPMTRLVIKGEDGGRRARCLVSALKEEGVHASCLPAREGNAWQVFFRGKEPRSVLAKLDVRGVSIDREPQEW